MTAALRRIERIPDWPPPDGENLPRSAIQVMVETSGLLRHAGLPIAMELQQQPEPYFELLGELVGTEPVQVRATGPFVGPAAAGDFGFLQFLGLVADALAIAGAAARIIATLNERGAETYIGEKEANKLARYYLQQGGFDPQMKYVSSGPLPGEGLTLTGAPRTVGGWNTVFAAGPRELVAVTVDTRGLLVGIHSIRP